MKPTRQNTLYLTIKQVFFDEIIAGTKTKEYREIKNTRSISSVMKMDFHIMI